MAGTFGNQNAVGNRGGPGRKSLYAERADAEFLWKMFTEDANRTQLKKRIKTGKHSILDMMILRALGGSEKLMGDIFKKLFPDSMNMTANLNQKQMATLENNIRTLIEVAGGGAKKKVIVGSDPERLSQSIKAASEALKKTKTKVKLKLKVKVKTK